MIRETPFLAFWREVCPKLWLGEAIRVWRAVNYGPWGQA